MLQVFLLTNASIFSSIRIRCASMLLETTQIEVTLDLRMTLQYAAPLDQCVYQDHAHAIMTFC